MSLTDGEKSQIRRLRSEFENDKSQYGEWGDVLEIIDRLQKEDDRLKKALETCKRQRDRYTILGFKFDESLDKILSGETEGYK